MNISEGMSGQIRGWRRWARQLAVCCLALGLLLSTLPAAAAVVDFTVLSVNDFHGSLMASGKNPGIARLATFFSQQRNQNPGGVLLLAGGDMMQGSMESNLVYGASVIDAMNYVRFDGMVLGNHEFDWGIDRLRQRAAEARFPFLAANVVEKAGGQVMDFTQPYHIYDVNGVRVAVIGLTTLETVQTTHPKNVVSLDFLSPAATAGLYVPLVRQQGADVVVLLCHMGGEQTGEGGVSGEIADLALNVDGVDLIISGHSHTVLNGRLNGVPVVQAGAYGRGVAVVRFAYDTDRRQAECSGADVVDINKLNLPADPGMEAVLSKIDQTVAPIRDQVVASSQHGLAHAIGPQVTPLGEWVTDTIRRYSQADIAVFNSGGIRTSLPAGSITMGNIYQVLPFDNVICTVMLNKWQLYELFEYGLTTGSNPPVMMQFSGVRVEYDPRRSPGRQLVSLTLADGSPLAEDRLYKVAVNDFMLAGGEGFKVLQKGVDPVTTADVVREVIVAAARQQQTIDWQDDGRLTPVQSQPVT